MHVVLFLQLWCSAWWPFRLPELCHKLSSVFSVVFIACHKVFIPSTWKVFCLNSPLPGNSNLASWQVKRLGLRMSLQVIHQADAIQFLWHEPTRSISTHSYRGYYWLSSVFNLLVPIYTPGWRETMWEQHLSQEHNTMSPDRVEPQTAQSRDEHEATAPPSECLFQGGYGYFFISSCDSVAHTVEFRFFEPRGKQKFGSKNRII